MKVIKIVILFMIYSSIGFAQQMNFPHIPCVVIEEEEDLLFSQSSNINTANITEKKLVRINMHFIQKNDGTGNFSETDDGYGNDFNGYDISYEILNYINSRGNVSLNIPPNNNLAVNNFNVKFVLDAVFFHKNTALYPNATGTAIYTTYKDNHTEVLQIFHRGDGYYDYATSLSSTSSTKYVSMKALHNNYVDYINGTISAYMHGTGVTTLHELYHLLTLSHTVRGNSTGVVCDETNPNVCNDSCADTPTPYEMVNVYNNPQTSLNEPACGWTNWSTYWCSNNLMDYSGFWALSPCQVERVHTALENGMVNFRACKATNTNTSVCDLGYPQISFFGKEVTIGCSPTSTAILEADQKSDVYFSEGIEIEGEFEVENGADFEVFVLEGCP